MYRLISEGNELVLPHDFVPDFNLNFAEFGKLLGSRVFPTVLPNCPENDAYFGFAFDVQSNTNRKKKWVATLMQDSLFLAQGWLVLKSASKKNGYVCELQMPPGLIESDVWNKNIQELDFGSIQLNTSLVTDNSYFLKITQEIKNRYPIHVGGMEIRIHVNTVEWLYKYLPRQSSNQYYDSGIDPWQDLYDELISLFNTEQRLSSGYQLDARNDNIILVTPTGNQTVTITINWNLNYQNTYNFTQVSYQSAAAQYDTFVNNTPQNSMFCLPTIHAPNFYGSDNKNFYGYLNVMSNNKFTKNSVKEPCMFSIAPCLFVVNTIKKLCEILGYTATGDIISNSTYQFSYFLTLVSADKQAQEVDFVLNTWAEKINFADYLPKMAVKDFFEAISVFLLADISFDFVSKTIEFRSIKPLIDSITTKDVSMKLNDKVYLIEHNDYEKIQLKFEDLHESESNDSYFNAVPLDSEKEENVTYKTISYLFCPPKLVNISDDNSINFIRKRANGGIGVVSTTTNRFIPVTQKEGVTKIYGEKSITPSKYISFFLGVIQPVESSMLHSINEKDGVSLQIVGTNGFASRNTTLINHLENTYTLKADISIFSHELSSMKSWQKFYINGVNFFLSNMQGKLNKNMTVKLKKV